jgi:hypothetical protein
MMYTPTSTDPTTATEKETLVRRGMIIDFDYALDLSKLDNTVTPGHRTVSFN